MKIEEEIEGILRDERSGKWDLSRLNMSSGGLGHLVAGVGWHFSQRSSVDVFLFLNSKKARWIGCFGRSIVLSCRV